MTMARTIRLYALPETPRLAGIRPLEPRDVPAACVLLNAYLLRCAPRRPASPLRPSPLAAAPAPAFRRRRFKLAPHYTEEEFAHALLPRPGVIDSYVIDDPAATVPGISGLVSFYHLPSTVIGERAGAGPWRVRS